MFYLQDLILSAQITPHCWYVFTSDEIQVETCVLLLQTINTNKQIHNCKLLWLSFPPNHNQSKPNRDPESG